MSGGKNIVFCILLSLVLVLPACKEPSAKKVQVKSVLVYGKIPPKHKISKKLLKGAEAEKKAAALSNSAKLGAVDGKTADAKSVKAGVGKGQIKNDADSKEQFEKDVNKKNVVKQSAGDNSTAKISKKYVSGSSFKDIPVYCSEGKVDPFAPLIRTNHKKVSANLGKRKKPRRALTPLEKFDFSQIRLVAVITAKSGNIAMVEDSSHKGYTIRIGTYIGKNEGRVVKIEKDRVIVKEHVQNLEGESVIRSQVLKLNKPDNGD